jgi:hypothetical protein
MSVDPHDPQGKTTVHGNIWIKSPKFEDEYWNPRYLLRLIPGQSAYAYFQTSYQTGHISADVNYRMIYYEQYVSSDPNLY